MELNCIFHLKRFLESSHEIDPFDRYDLRILENGRVDLDIGYQLELGKTIGFSLEMANNIKKIIESHYETISELKDFYYDEGWTNPTYVTLGFGDIQIKASDIKRWSDENIEDLRIRNVPGHEKFIENIKKAALILDIYDEIAMEYNKYIENEADHLTITKQEAERGRSEAPRLVALTEERYLDLLSPFS